MNEITFCPKNKSRFILIAGSLLLLLTLSMCQVKAVRAAADYDGAVQAILAVLYDHAASVNIEDYSMPTQTAALTKL